MIGTYRQDSLLNNSQLRSPLDIAGVYLTAWYDASQVVANEGDRTVWDVEFGVSNGMERVDPADTQPLYRKTDWYGRPAFEFHGDLSDLTLHNSSQANHLGFQNSPSWTLAAVMRVTNRALGNQDLRLEMDLASPDNDVKFLFPGTAGGDATQLSIELPGSIGTDFVVTHPYDADAAIFMVTADDMAKQFTSHITPLTDGGVIGQSQTDAIGAPINTEPVATTIKLATANLSTDSAMQVAEIVVIDRALTSNEQTQLNAYLWDKWQKRPVV